MANPEQVDVLKDAQTDLDDMRQCSCKLCTMIREKITRPMFTALIEIAQEHDNLQEIGLKLAEIMGETVGLLADDPDQTEDEIAKVVALAAELFALQAMDVAGFEGCFSAEIIQPPTDETVTRH